MEVKKKNVLKTVLRNQLPIFLLYNESSVIIYMSLKTIKKGGERITSLKLNSNFPLSEEDKKKESKHKQIQNIYSLQFIK